LILRCAIPVAPAKCAEHEIEKVISFIYRLPPDELRPAEEEEEEEEEEDPADDPELRLPPDEYEPPPEL
jgi:hypothetical protein